jgi:predicted nucleic acid-binding protein
VSYLIDTCALSELIRPIPSPAVVKWFEAVPQTSLFVSALTFGEIRKGVERLPLGARRSRISAWLETELQEWFGDRVLPVDKAVADEWGRLVVRIGQTMPAIDGLIAATALRHRLTIVTRNVDDFAKAGVEIVNPWRDA